MGKFAWVVLSAALLLVSAAPAFSQGQETDAKPATDTKNLLKPEDFLTLRSLQDPQLSPDGSKVAFVASNPQTGEKRVRHIWLLDVATGTARQLTYSEKSENYPRWSPDGKRLAFLSNRGGEYEQIYLLRIEGGEASPLTKEKASVDAFAWAPDGKSIAYIASDPKTEAEEKKEKEKDDARVADKDDKQGRLRVLDLATNESRALTPATWRVEGLDWMADGQGLFVIGTRKPASDRFEDSIYAVWLRGGQDEIRAPHGPISDIHVSPDGRLVSFLGARDDGPNPFDLWVIGTEGGVARNITGASLDRQVDEYHWTKEGAVLVNFSEGFRNRLALYTREGERKDLKEFTTNPGPFSVSGDGTIAFVGQTATTPQEIWLLKPTGEPQQRTHLHAEWKHELATPEITHYKSFDGQEIEAALLKPKAYDGKAKLPAIVLVHGGPTGRWQDSVEPWGQMLAARGYAVLYPNVRGSTGYSEKFIEMNRADWGGADFKDVMAGVQNMLDMGIADSNRLGIGGWSYGGYMAEWAVTQTDKFRAAVSGAGMANLISEFGTERGPAYDEWFFGVPYEHPENFLNSSPFIHFKAAKTPTLIFQGENDPIDPIGQGQELYRGLKRYGVETELVLYPREPHGFQERQHRIDMQNRMLAWFDKYLTPAK